MVNVLESAQKITTLAVSLESATASIPQVRNIISEKLLRYCKNAKLAGYNKRKFLGNQTTKHAKKMIIKPLL